MRKFECYWQSNDDWCFFNDSGVLVLKPDAPVEAEKSYLRYLKQIGTTREQYEKTY